MVVVDFFVDLWWLLTCGCWLVVVVDFFVDLWWLLTCGGC